MTTTHRVRFGVGFGIVLNDHDTAKTRRSSLALHGSHPDSTYITHLHLRVPWSEHRYAIKVGVSFSFPPGADWLIDWKIARKDLVARRVICGHLKAFHLVIESDHSHFESRLNSSTVLVLDSDLLLLILLQVGLALDSSCSHEPFSQSQWHRSRLQYFLCGINLGVIHAYE